MSASLELGNGNWAVKSDALLGYKTINGKYYPREFAVTRATTATRVNPQGVVELTPYNLASWSEQFDNVYWTKTASTVTSNSVVSPSGATDADTLTADGTSSRHDALLVLSATTGTIYTYSVYAKKNTNDFIQLSTGGGFGSNVWANFNLATGVVGSVGSLTTASIQSVGDGWYRCTMTGAATLTGTTGIYNLIVTSTTASRLEVNTLTTSVFLWGAQLVEGTEPLDYLPTTDRLDVARIDYSLGSANLLLEPQRTNSVRNSSTVGAVVGSPGTLPNGWSSSTNSMSRAVVGLGTENGLPYVDIRIFGTATSGTCVVSPIQPAIQSAASGQVWSGSLYVKLIAAPLAPISYAMQVVEWVGSSFLAATTSALALSSSLKRFEGTRTLNNASTTSVTHYFSAGVIAGQTYDFTVRIAAPQLELGAYATSYIPTTTASVTRVQDSVIKTGISALIGQTEGTIFLDFYFGQLTNAGFRTFFTLEGNVANQFSGFSVNTSNNGNTIAYAGVTYPLTTGRHKVACTYSQTSNERKFYVDGVLVATSAHTNFLAEIDKISVGCRTNAFAAFSTDRPLDTKSGIIALKVHPEVLTNAELISLTTL